jgi:isocitrate dehydrogenase kinase/phosphatase
MPESNTQSPASLAIARRQLAQPGADTMHNAFAVYQQEFKSITRRAKARFEDRDWHGAHADAVERLALYPRIIRQVVADIRAALGEAIHDRFV